MGIRVFVKFKTGEIREYKNVVWVKQSDQGVEMEDFLGLNVSISNEQVDVVKIVAL